MKKFEPIYVASGPQELRRRLASLKGPFCLLTNPRVARFCLPPLRPLLGKIPVVQIPDGERYKNLQTVEKVYHQLIRLKMDRRTILLLLGGGVVGDLGGYVAATFLRGIRFVQLPTSLVGQVDSSIGGKVGVDLPEGKNLVGAFYHPEFVYSNVSFLKSLPERELKGGVAEVLKYGIIREGNFFHWVVDHKKTIFARDTDLLKKVVATSAAVKEEVVSRDEREKGLRRILNFGHTFGHALERLTHYRRYTHGEAIAIGMAIAARLSRRLGYCDPQTEETIVSGIREMGLPTKIPPLPSSCWLQGIGVDKKREGGKIHFVFCERLGRVVVEPFSPEKLVRSL